MNLPNLQRYTDAFTAATVDADGYATSFHAGTAAALRLLLQTLALLRPADGADYLCALAVEVKVTDDPSTATARLSHGLSDHARRSPTSSHDHAKPL